MYDILKNILISSIFVLIIYFGFIHNVEILQILIGILWAATLVVMAVGIAYGNFEEVAKYKNTLKNSYKPYRFILFIIVILVTCWILYTSYSYNFLSVYIIIVILSFIIRYKAYTALKTK